MTWRIGVLHPTDVDAALALSGAEGWNQSADDWRRLLRLEPDGCFAARAGGRLIGTVTTTTYGRHMAWIGMMVIHPDHRGQGIGAALMRTALDHLARLGIPSVKLDATPAGRPLYESLGFVAEAEVERWQGVANLHDSRDGWRTSQGLQQLNELDEAGFGADRSRLLELLVSEGRCDPLVVDSDHAAPAGFALARRARVATYIGPVIAESARAAESLLDGMLGRLAGPEVCLDFHVGGQLTREILVNRGLAKRRGLTRMRFGRHTSAGIGDSICASAGPEYG